MRTGREQNLLLVFNLVFPVGSMMTIFALAGPSGSGKSTILRLLLGFETPGSGSIRYGGKDPAALDVHKLRRWNLGVVRQGSGLRTSIGEGSRSFGMARGK